MTFCKVNDCSRTVTFKAEVDSGFCVEHLDIHLGDLRTQAEIATKLVERLRNCFICIECGRCTADEDACCTTCGRDCMAFEDGKLVHKIVDHVESLERSAATLEAVAAARDAACDRLESWLSALPPNLQAAGERDVAELRNAGRKTS